MNLCLAKFLNVALLSCVAVLGLGRPAEAAYVVVNADPAFGEAFPELGWRATGALYVPDTCAYVAILGSGLSGFSPYSVSLSTLPASSLCAGSQLQDVKLYFYNLNDPTKNVELLKIGDYGADVGPEKADRDDLTQELIDFAFDTTFSISPFRASASIVEFHTTLSDPIQAMDPLAGSGEYDFALEFSSVSSRLVAINRLTGVRIDSLDNAVVTISSLRGLVPGMADEYQRTADEPVFPTARVPEPLSLTLTLTALAAALGAGSLRRRSRRV